MAGLGRHRCSLPTRHPAGGTRRCVPRGRTVEAGEAGLHPPLILQAPLVSPLVLVSLPRSIKSHLLGDGPRATSADATAPPPPPARGSAGCSVLGHVTRVGGWEGLGVWRGGHNPSDECAEASKATPRPQQLVQTLPRAQMLPTREWMDHGGAKMRRKPLEPAGGWSYRRKQEGAHPAANRKRVPPPTSLLAGEISAPLSSGEPGSPARPCTRHAVSWPPVPHRPRHSLRQNSR